VRDAIRCVFGDAGQHRGQRARGRAAPETDRWTSAGWLAGARERAGHGSTDAIEPPVAEARTSLLKASGRRG
jgi:hypothetical protein